MMEKKHAFFALVLLTLATNACAASIEAQETTPEKTVWSFAVRLPAGTDFDNAQVLLDGTNLIEFYTNPSNETIAYNQDSERLFSNTEPEGNKVYFLVSPQATGEHTIRLEIDGETQDEKTLLFFEIYDAEGKADLQTQVNSLRGSVNSLIEQMNTMNDTLEQTMTQEDKQALQTSINNIDSSLTELEQKLEQQETENNAKTSVLLEDVQRLQEKTNDLNKAIAPGIGFAALGAIDDTAKTGLGLLALAIIAAVLIIRYKDRLPINKGIYGNWKKKPLFSEHDEEIAEQVLEESQDESQKGKWAFGHEPKQEKEEPKRFNLGDLIR